VLLNSDGFVNESDVALFAEQFGMQSTSERFRLRYESLNKLSCAICISGVDSTENNVICVLYIIFSVSCDIGKKSVV